MKSNDWLSAPHCRRARLGAGVLLACGALASTTTAQDLIFQQGLSVDSAGVAQWRAAPLEFTLDTSGVIGGIPDRFSGVHNYMLLRVGMTANAWSGVVVTLLDGPGAPGNLFPGTGSSYPAQVGVIDRGISVSCSSGGTIYPDSLCVELDKFAPTGFYLLRADTYLGGTLTGSSQTLVRVGAGPWSPPAPSGQLYTIIGASDGGSYSYALTSGSASTSAGALTSLTTRPAMTLQPGLGVGSPASSFVQAFIASINSAFTPLFSAAQGPFLQTFGISTSTGNPFYFWIGDGLGNPTCMLGSMGSCRFNPLVQGTQSHFAVYGVDVRHGRMWASDPADFLDSFLDYADQTAPITGLDYDTGGDVLWATFGATHEFGTLSRDDGLLHALGTLSGPPASVALTGLTSTPDPEVWYLATYDSSLVVSELWVGDPADGVFTNVGPINTGHISELACSANGDLFGVDANDDALWGIDPQSGFGTQIGALGLSVAGTQGLDFDWSSGVLYANLWAGTGLASFCTLDTTSGAATILADSGANDRELKLAIDAGLGETGRPHDDDCATPSEIEGQGSFPFDLSAATTGSEGQLESACLFFGSTAVERDVWALWTADATGLATLDTCGSNVDTKIAVWPAQGCPLAGTSLACNDDDSCGLQSRVSLPVVAGAQYLLQIGTFPGAAAGKGELHAGIGVTPTNDDCATPTVVGNGVHLGTLEGATNDGTASCGASSSSPDVWYDYTASCTGTLTVSTCGTNDGPGIDQGIDTVLALLDSCGGSELACNDDDQLTACAGLDVGARLDSAVSILVVSGQSILVRVSNFFNGSRGPFTLRIDCSSGGGVPYCDPGQSNSVSAGGAILSCTGGWGTASAAFLLTDVPTQPGLLYAGPSQLQLAFGCGERCVGGSIIRGIPFIPSSTTVSTTFDMSSSSTLNIQYWYRDPANFSVCGSGFNLSNALMP